MRPRLLWWILASPALAACGDNGLAPTPDAGAATGADAAVLGCFPLGDYVEADDAGNDPTQGGAAETTLATTAPGTRVRIGGCLDPRHATAGAGDTDAFGFALGGDGPSFLSARLTSPRGAPIDGAQLILLDANGDAFAGARVTAGAATLAPVRVPPGAYRAIVREPDGTIATARTYQLELAAFACATPATATAHEAADGDGTANDLLAVTTAATTVATPTAADDAPEDGGAAGPGDVVSLAGELAVRAPAGDDYLDRDTWQVALGAGAGRVAIVIDWVQTGDEDDDVDGLALPAASPEALAGAGLGLARPEAFGAVLGPGDAWLWVGARVGASARTTPLPYTLTACVFD